MANSNGVLQPGRSIATRMKAAAAPYVPGPVLLAWKALTRGLNRLLPKGLFARSLLIIVVPILILQTVLTVVFLDRHWQLTTRRLSASVARDIGAIVGLMRDVPEGPVRQHLIEKSGEHLEMRVQVLPGSQLQDEATSDFDVLHSALTSEILNRLHASSSIVSLNDWEVEIRIFDGVETLAFVVPRANAYASNWHIFLVWMMSTSLVLILVSVLFLRNQIRPIERLADAMERFGKGQAVGQFHIAGAREVRRAALAFQDMRRRIERQMEQRTAMLAGVSHDLRTILTRFRLELAFLGEDADAMRRDADDMEAMLESYLAFARGDADEARSQAHIERLLAEAVHDARRTGADVALNFQGDPMVSVRPGGFRRLIDNLVGNAVRYGKQVMIEGHHAEGYLIVTVDDDGPGIPPEAREDVFRPFFRLDSARNQDQSGTGLGLAIVRDVARMHGGDVRLVESPMGGCRAVVRIPG